MMIAAAVLGVLGGLVLGLHMVRTFTERRSLSAARFLRVLPPPRESKWRWHWANPFKMSILYPRLVVLALSGAALLVSQCAVQRTTRPQELGLWLWVDTSASMGAQMGGSTRLQAAIADLGSLLEEVRARESVESLCVRVSTFDLAASDLLASGDVAAARQALSGLRPRALGTNLALVTAAAAQNPEPGECPTTHVIVATDLPAPPLAEPGDGPEIVWRVAAQPVANAGFTELGLEREAGSERRALRIAVRGYGDVSAELTVRLEAITEGAPPAEVVTLSVVWQQQGEESLWETRLSDLLPGRYSVSLEPVDAYPLDNRLEIEVPALVPLRVDWRAPGPEWVTTLGWQAETVAPDLRVQSASEPIPVDGVPTLLLGSGYGLPQTPAPLGVFADNHPVLDLVNLDTVEATGLSRFTPLNQLPEGFVALLGGLGNDGPVWVAARAGPPAVVIPGLPGSESPDEPSWRLAATLFANSVAWLTQARAEPPLYTLTTVQQPEPEGSRVALHPGEGNTMRVGESLNAEAIGRTPQQVESAQHIWPWLLLGALTMILLERVLSARAAR